MKKWIYIIIGAATWLSACEEVEPMRYDMSQGRVSFPGITSAEQTEHPGYSNSDSTFYVSQTFKKQPAGTTEMVVSVSVKLLGAAVGHDRQIGFRVLTEGTTAKADQYSLVSATIPAGETYGAIRIKVKKSPDLDTGQQTLMLRLTASPDLGVGVWYYLKANVSWHNMLDRPSLPLQWTTYNAFIASDLSATSKSPEAYSQAAHQLLLDAFGWTEIPKYGPDYSNYLAAWREKTQAWYDAWKAANPGKKIIHEGGMMKGKEVQIRMK